jgi:hypothetical protein
MNGLSGISMSGKQRDPAFKIDSNQFRRRLFQKRRQHTLPGPVLLTPTERET